MNSQPAHPASVPLTDAALTARSGAKTYHLSPSARRDPAVTTSNRQADRRPADGLHEALAEGARHLAERRLEDAFRSFQAALAIEPDDPAAHLNLAVTLRRGGYPQDSRRSFERALSLAPQWPEVHQGLAQLLLDLGDADSAIEHLSRAVELAPDRPNAHHALGLALRHAGRHGESLAAFDRALERCETWPSARHNRAVALQHLGRDDEALAEYESLAAAGSEHWETHNNLAFMLLRRGDYRRGFRELEWRFRQGGETPRRLNRPQPVWQGEPLNGRIVLLCEEQGAGDMIQFVRLAASLGRLGGRALVECGRPLRRLFESVPGVEACVLPDEDCTEADFQLPLLSLPRLLGLTLEELPDCVPYVAASEDPRLASISQGLDSQLTGSADRLKVGIVWEGSAENLVNARRSCSPEDFAPLAADPRVDLFSLQFAPAEVMEGRLEGLPIGSLAPWLGDFAHTAAVLDRLDLVITVDTSMAHLAGALGKETWVLLHSPDADWRWLESRCDSPWYPTVRLFRQGRPGDWLDVMHRVAVALAEVSS